MLLSEISPERVKEIEQEARQEFLFETCQKFIQKNQICESLDICEFLDIGYFHYETADFIREICQIVGYHKHS